MHPDQPPGGSPAKTIVVIPTYNEAANLPALVDELLALPVPDLSVLVVDDNSPDGTGEIADDLSQRLAGRVHVKHRPRRQGLGKAYLDGFDCALGLGADHIIQMDADFSHPPRAIPLMLATLADCDVVVGSRYVSGGRLDERWGWWRRFLSWWANEVWSRGILGLRTRDITAGFKCWRRDTLAGIGLQRVGSQGYAFQVEMAFLCERLGYRITEIPIHFDDRRIGQSKMSGRVKLEGAWDVIKLRWRYRSLTR